MHPRRFAGPLSCLSLLCWLASTAAVADPCAQAQQLIQSAQQRTLADELATAQRAVQLCDAYPEQLFLAHVLGARSQWQQAQAAYLDARSRAGGDAGKVSEVDMELALLKAAEPGQDCKAIALFTAAADERAERGLGPPPAWFTQQRRAVESRWTRDGVSAAELRCALDERRSLQRAWHTTDNGQRQRLFCGEHLVDLPVHFDTGSAALAGAARRQVGALGEVLRTLLREGQDGVRLDGHTDERGTDTYNQMLSERRAASVADALRASLEMRRLQLMPVGHGRTQPKYPGHTDEDYRLNRRVEVTLVPLDCRL